MGPEGPEGPPGLIDVFNVAVESDIGLTGRLIAGSFQPTPGTPGTLTVAAPQPGTYLLTWYAEIMRTTAVPGAMFAARLRDVTGAATRGFLRDGSGVDNGATGAMPNDTDFFSTGDILPFSGSLVVRLSGASQTYQLEYAQSSTSPNAAEVLRARRQRITLMRVQ
jgi:hypothetical protein